MTNVFKTISQNLPEKKDQAAVYSTMSAFTVFALATLMFFIYGIIVAAYTGTILLGVIFWGLAIFLAGGAVAFLLLLFSLFEKYGIEFKKAPDRSTFKTLTRVLLIAGAVVIVFFIAMNGMTKGTWMDGTTKLREKYGFNETPQKITLWYSDATEYENNAKRAEVEFNFFNSVSGDGSKILAVVYNEYYRGQLVITSVYSDGTTSQTNRFAEFSDGEAIDDSGKTVVKIIINETEPPKYPKIVWWAFK